MGAGGVRRQEKTNKQKKRTPSIDRLNSRLSRVSLMVNTPHNHVAQRSIRMADLRPDPRSGPAQPSTACIDLNRTPGSCNIGAALLNVIEPPPAGGHCNHELPHQTDTPARRLTDSGIGNCQITHSIGLRSKTLRPSIYQLNLNGAQSQESEER